MNARQALLSLSLVFGTVLLCCGTSLLAEQQDGVRIGSGEPREPRINAGWRADQFPEHAACYRSAKEIAELYRKVLRGKQNPVTSYPKPSDGSLRIVGTGHSFMAPGYKAFPTVARSAGLKQPPLVTHTSGGIRGSARYKWEEENGIFQFDGKPKPKLLASISGGEWDVMMWGPYYHDRPAYYECWIDFCLKYNPDMKFYLMNAWPQLAQLEKVPDSEDELSPETVARMGKVKQDVYVKLVTKLNKKYPNKVFVVPTCEAMVLAVKYYHDGALPGVEGIHRLIGKKERSLWRDMIGHLGPGIGNLEGYVFYATLYGKSPEHIGGDVFRSSQGYPSRQLDETFRKIAWQAVANSALTGVVDKDKDGLADGRN